MELFFVHDAVGDVVLPVFAFHQVVLQSLGRHFILHLLVCLVAPDVRQLVLAALKPHEIVEVGAICQPNRLFWYACCLLFEFGDFRLEPHHNFFEQSRVALLAQVVAELRLDSCSDYV